MSGAEQEFREQLFAVLEALKGGSPYHINDEINKLKCLHELQLIADSFTEEG